jgi:hypothetical protein
MDVISGSVDQTSSPEAKIALFRSLFRGRDDVYPRRFESRKTGRAGYAPACANEWVRGVCEKPRIKCAECLLGKYPELFCLLPRRFRQRAVPFGTVTLLIRFLPKIFSIFPPLLGLHAVHLRPSLVVGHIASLHSSDRWDHRWDRAKRRC